MSTISSRLRNILGRALRETGQALDRVGIRGNVHATKVKEFGGENYIFQDHLSRHRNFMPLLRRGIPYIDEDVAFISPCSSIIGKVHIGARSSVWYGTVIRADRCNLVSGFLADGQDNSEMYKGEVKLMNRDCNDINRGGEIFIGKETTIRDGCVIASILKHTVIGNGVTVGHMSSINSSTIEDSCVIGMGSILCTGSLVQTLSVVAPGTVIEKDVIVKSGEFWFGNPGRKLRDLTEEEKKGIVNQVHENNIVARNERHVMSLGGNVPNEILDSLMVK